MRKLVLALAAAGSLMAFEGGHHGFGIRSALKSLDLNEAQQQSIKALVADAREQHEVKDRAAKPDYAGAFAKAFGADVFDRDAFVAQHNEGVTKRADFFASLHAILTPDQRLSLIKNIESKKEKK
ncbi:hypothetical protein AGMMS50229_06200 [Campylobacterota bacterium]|nr:hypothetical protein AGMMS50229_06200 [Campylobacterota bacterium]